MPQSHRNDQNSFSRKQNRPSRKQNRLVRMMVVNWAFGWGVGFACALAVLAADLGRIRELMVEADLVAQALALLFIGFGVTFGGVVAATAIMLLPTDEEEWRGGGTRAPVLLPAYAYARIRGART
jgi:hypothetical protein